MECKLLHCEYKASRGIDIKVQCIVFSRLICSQHAIEMDLVSQKDLNFSDSSPISVSKKLSKFFYTKLNLNRL